MVVQSPRVVLAFCALFVLCALVEKSYAGGLKSDFYKHTQCSYAEDVIKTITTQKVLAKPSLAAKLVRLHFHDCFVRGCDASVLLETMSQSNPAEKDAFPNLSLGGFDVIADIKSKLGPDCANVVSCADILALAARDAVTALSPFAWWEVKTGRRDGIVSNATEVFENLPTPFDDFDTLKENFDNKGLNIVDLVALSGAHTIGITHCGLVGLRLYNFNGQPGVTDPSIDSGYAQALKQICPQNGDPNKEVDMDPNSAESFDGNYFKIVKGNKGIFTSDAALLNSTASRALVNLMQADVVFFKKFGISMQRMGSIEVLTGTAGQIRRDCSVVN